jgi:PAT family beta-lactamase induction signal transducer AmpG
MFNKLYSVYLLSLTSGILSGFSKFGVSMWLKFSNVDIVALNIFGLMLMPYSLKVFWMPFIGYIGVKFGNYGGKKSLMILLDFLLFIMTAMLYWVNVSHLYLLTIYFFIYSCLITTRESIAIGYQIDFFDKSQIGKMEGKVNMFYHTGFWIGGPGILIFSDYLPWNVVFLIFSGALLMSFVAMLFIENSENLEEARVSFSEKFITPYYDLIKKNRQHWLALVCFLSFYKLQDRLLMGNLSYYFIDLGHDKHDIIVNKLLGVLSLIAGGFLSSACFRYFNYRLTMLIGIVFHASICASLVVQSSFMVKSYAFFYCVTVLEKIARGFQANIFFSYQTFFCSKQYAVSQITLLLALERLTSSIFSVYSGFIIKQLGWMNFFVFSFIGIVPAVLSLRRLPQVENDGKNSEKN